MLVDRAENHQYSIFLNCLKSLNRTRSSPSRPIRNYYVTLLNNTTGFWKIVSGCFQQNKHAIRHIAVAQVGRYAQVCQCQQNTSVHRTCKFCTSWQRGWNKRENECNGTGRDDQALDEAGSAGLPHTKFYPPPSPGPYFPT